MNFLENFSRSFIANNRHSIIPVTTLYIPLAIEILFFCTHLYLEPKALTQKFKQIKQDISAAFLQQENETNDLYKKK
jgi:hypothetical protein